jgi:hypothetical protein
MDHITPPAQAESRKHVIAFNGEPVGVVVPDGGTLKFVAVKYHVWDLDARRFASLEAANHAVVAHLAGRRANAPVPSDIAA